MSGHISKLERLNLSRNELGHTGVEELASAFGSPPVTALRELDLTDCGISSGLASLEEVVGALLVLRISGNPLGPEGLAGVKLDESSQLESLYMSSVEAGDQGKHDQGKVLLI